MGNNQNKYLFFNLDGWLGAVRGGHLLMIKRWLILKFQAWARMMAFRQRLAPSPLWFVPTEGINFCNNGGFCRKNFHFKQTERSERHAMFSQSGRLTAVSIRASEPIANV